MDFNSIKDLISTMDNSKLDYLKVNWQGIEIIMKKDGEPIEQTTIIEKPEIEASKEKPIALPVLEASKEMKAEDSKEIIEKAPILEDKNCTIIKSPIVGTFYSSPSPEKPVFASVGAKVKKGDVLCIIEAMKLMNEIESDVDGEVIEILVNNEEMVEYGQPLFKIK